MRSKWKRWLLNIRKIVLREVLLLLLAGTIGLGWGMYQSERYLPTMDGNVYAMDPTGNSLFMVLSKEANNSLVHIDHSGTLLNYAVTKTNQAFENLVVLNDTIYAVLTTYEMGSSIQKLVCLSMEHTAMSMDVLLDLSAISQAAQARITWTGTYLPLEENPSKICLGGVDSAGNAYLLHWPLDTQRAQVEQILAGEAVYKLKYVNDGHYVWIDMQGRLGQYINGVWQRDIFWELDDNTPLHISTYQERVFVSDSRSGNIYEIEQDGTSRVCWYGTEPIRQSDYQYKDITIFTTYQDDSGEIQVIGLCTSKNGASNVVVGPEGTISELQMGTSRYRMIGLRSWWFGLLCFLILTVIVEILRAALRSPRMAVRLAMCELVMAGIMLGAVIGIQYSSYQTTIQEDARQKLQLLGGNLVDVLTTDDELKQEEVGQVTSEVLQRVQNSGQYTVNVVWLSDEGVPVIGYDDEIPYRYAVEDVKSRGYYTAVAQFLKGGKGAALQEIRNALNVNEFVYLRRITQTGGSGQGQLSSQEQWVGCVTVSQSESDILAGRGSFWLRMAPALVACPFLFALLMFVTWNLLRPLGVVREALEEFYDTGGGNKMDLTHMPKTELYEVGLVFNQLSQQTKVQFNTLAHINGAYTRLVPDCLYQMLHKEDVLALSPGAYAAVDGALLMLIPYTPARTARTLENLFYPASELIAAHNGMIVDYDEGLGAMTALFCDASQALSCAKETLRSYDNAGENVMAAIVRDTVEFGVFGSERLLYPVAVSGSLHRRQEVLSLMLEFGAVLVASGVVDNPNLRLLGWDGETSYYEDPACRPSGWRAQWKQAAPLWNEAIALFQDGEFSWAMRRFARVLRLLPEDVAARWYLFRCEVLRDEDSAQTPDTGLLYNWRDRHG